MSWVCVGCLERHMDDMEIMGFGLCKTCQDRVRIRKAKERLAVLKARSKKRKK